MNLERHCARALFNLCVWHLHTVCLSLRQTKDMWLWISRVLDRVLSVGEPTWVM